MLGVWFWLAHSLLAAMNHGLMQTTNPTRLGDFPLQPCLDQFLLPPGLDEPPTDCAALQVMAEELAGHINVCRDWGANTNPHTYHNLACMHELDLLQSIAVHEARHDLVGELPAIQEMAWDQLVVEARASMVAEILALATLTANEHAALEADARSRKQALEYEVQEAIIAPLCAQAQEEYTAQVHTLLAQHMEIRCTKAEKAAKAEYPCLFNEALAAACTCMEAEAHAEGVCIMDERLARLHATLDDTLCLNECVVIIAAACCAGLTPEDLDPACIPKPKSAKVAPHSATACASIA